MDVTGIQIERQWSAARRMYCTVQIERLDKLVVRKTILCATDVCDNGMSGSFPDGRVLVSCSHIFRTVLQLITVLQRVWTGPWMIPEDDVFDTRADYAIKTASDGEHRYAFGWIASKYGNCDFGPSGDGAETMVLHELVQDQATGALKVKVIPGIRDYYTKENEITQITSYNCELYKEKNAVDVMSQTFWAQDYMRFHMIVFQSNWMFM